SYNQYRSQFFFSKTLNFYINLQPIPLFKKIYQRLFDYIDRNSEYINVSTQHIDLPTNFERVIS
ncbi:hypothetical protein V7332_22595, partial [Bacillus thuringiensis]|uniref:hypothetical protein n=1 Tax=Bacillus thuringiensis TaxID=1428 RepID=UPI00302B6DB4